MKRILISQSEKNDGTDYVVVDGKLIKDQDLRLQYHKELRRSIEWNLNYKDDFLELKSFKNQILLKSQYLSKDDVNRNIYYTYLIENNENFETVIRYLEKDSLSINRTIDREKTLEIINKFKSEKKLKSNFKLILIALTAIGISTLIINALKH
ncbi:hypothetical protein [Christiangramia aquimixticola]|uniref:hypothetical protein n=1 Tax=Christiangramia aquimixticola TaxID=1697558 RepID=UPI003AA940FE